MSLRDMRIDDVAMMLARERGLPSEDIRRVMLQWALEAAEKAAKWAEEEDARLAAESRGA